MFKVIYANINISQLVNSGDCLFTARRTDLFTNKHPNSLVIMRITKSKLSGDTYYNNTYHREIILTVVQCGSCYGEVRAEQCRRNVVSAY